MIEVFAPCGGEIKDITTVEDDVFSQKMCGDGVSIYPDNGVICAPINGQIISIFHTNHAFTMKDENNIEYLIHIGIDTVHIEQNVFERLVQEKDIVKIGTPIIRADINAIVRNGLNPSVLVLVLNKTIKNKTINQNIDVSSKIYEVCLKD